MRERCYLAGIVALALLACGSDQNSAGQVVDVVGRIVEVQGMSADGGIHFLQPAAALSGPDGSVYVLDRGAKVVYRIHRDRQVDTLGRPGSGPGEFQDPSDLLWLDSITIGVVDAGNGRVQQISGDGTPTGTIPFSFGPTSVVRGPGDTLYTAAFARSFALGADGPEIREKGLVTAISANDGSVLTEFGMPRPYDGRVIPLFGNAVSAVFDRDARSVWIAWPLEPVLMEFSPEGVRRREVQRTLSFDPPPPTEYRVPGSPLPAGDYQRVTLGLTTDSLGQLILLAPRAAKSGRLADPDYVPPPQQLEIYEAGVLRCQVPLTVAGTSLSAGEPNSVFIVDALNTAEVYRVRYDCPSVLD